MTSEVEESGTGVNGLNQMLAACGTQLHLEHSPGCQVFTASMPSQKRRTLHATKVNLSKQQNLINENLYVVLN